MELRFSESTKNMGKLLLIIGAVYFFLRFLCPVTAPFLMAGIFVMIFGPLSLKLQNKLFLPRQIWTAMFLILGMVPFGGLLLLLGMFVTENLPLWAEAALGFLQNLGLPSGELERFLPSLLNGIWPYMLGVGKGGATFIIFVIASLFLAKEYDTLVERMLDNTRFHLLLQVALRVVRYVAIFVKAQAVILFCISSVCCLVLSLLRVESGIFYGLLAGILDALPFIGTGIVLLPLALSMFLAGRCMAGGVILFLYVGCIFIRELLEPRLIGKRAGMPPLLVLFSVYVGVSLFGIWGILKGPFGFLLISMLWEAFSAEEEIVEES